MLGELIELGAALLAAAALLLVLVAFAPSPVPIAGALAVLAVYGAYAAQGYAGERVPRVALRRGHAPETSDDGDDRPGSWLPDECTMDEFKRALADARGELAVTQVTAIAELQRLVAAGVADVRDDRIVRL